MVAKITSGGGMFGVLKYNVDKVEEKKADILMCNNMIAGSEKEPDIHLMMDCFDRCLSNNKRTKKPVFHVSLNPHPDDQLTDEQLKEIAQEYMQKMGYGNQPYIVFKHRDLEREHIHIVSVRTDEQGNKINDSHEHRHSKQITNQIENKYGLKPSTPGEETSLSELKKVDYKVHDVKRQVRNTVKELIKYRFQSIKEFNALLSIYNIGCEEVKGIVNEKPYAGFVYFALDEKGNPTGTRFKSSLWGKQIGRDALLKRIENSKTELKAPEAKERIKREIAACMNIRNPDEFKQKLKEKDIDVLFRVNPEKRIYGVTFIDHRNKAVFNGSKLGKEFSANVFHDLFSGNPTPEQANRPEQVRQNKTTETGTDWFGLLLPTDQNQITTETDIIRKRKKRKRRKPTL